jgi:hypothetical protein
LIKLVHARRLVSLETLLTQLAPHNPNGKATAAPPRTAGAAPVRSDPIKVREFQPPRPRPVQATPEPRSAPAAAPQEDFSPAAASTAGEDPKLASIKAILFDQKKRLLSSCLEHLSGWRFENGDGRFFFNRKDSFYCDILNSHEQQQALRSACAQVLGQPVKIYVTLEEQGAEAQAPRQSARERAEHDPGVEAFRKKLDATVVDVQDLSQE